MTRPDDWAFVRSLVDYGVGYDVEVSAQNLCTKEARQRGLDYQPYLYGIISVLRRPLVVVETGVRSGVSTKFALAALHRAKCGHLYSCDPMYRDQIHAEDALHKHLDFSKILPLAWTFWGEQSCLALTRIDPPLWDVFIHDSDHGYSNMKWELEYAWERLKSGGVLICDNFDWGIENYPHVPTPRHHAWDEFLEERGIVEYSLLGPQTAVVVKDD